MTKISRFAKWHEPATKGDVASAMIAIRSAMVQLSGAMIAQEQGDSDTWAKEMARYFEKWDILTERFHEIAGAEFEDE